MIFKGEDLRASKNQKEYKAAERGRLDVTPISVPCSMYLKWCAINITPRA
jgi:hypothetical protein